MDKDEYIEHAIENAGMTADEGLCSFYILRVWEAYLNLPVQHRDDELEAKDAIHVLQNLMAFRVARREHPKFWKNEEVHRQ